MNVLPPPKGLDMSEIATDAGLRAAIGREADKLKDSGRSGNRLDEDEIRLITFLASEVLRRFANLSREEKKELARIREKAEERETERRIREIVGNVDQFIEDTTTPKTAIRFSLINELEIRIESMQSALSGDARMYEGFLGKLQDAIKKLEEAKTKRRSLQGFREFN